MQIPEHYLDGCMAIPDKDERNAIIAAIVFYLYAGETPEGLSGNPHALWVAIQGELKTYRARRVSGLRGGKANAEKHGDTKREPISSRKRFMVLERDGYTCQYCGARAPEARLHVDHIVPVSKGGTNDLDNLVTACEQCNLGKSDIATTRFDGR